MHLAGSGRVIVQLTSRVSTGETLYDEHSVRVAKVVELIGPVKRPYASAQPLTNSIKKYAGRDVFVSGTVARKKRNDTK